MENMKEQDGKVRHYHAEIYTVQKIGLELDKSGKVLRVRITGPDGDITHRPSKRVVETKNIAGFDTVTEKKDLYDINEFIAEYPMLKALNLSCKDAVQEIVCSYSDIASWDDREEEMRYYRFMRKGQFDLIYWKPHDQDDTSKIDKMNEYKNKYATVDL